MTTFVLHGGETSRKTHSNDLFFQQFTSLVDKKNVKILMCYFAMEKNRWQELFERDSNKLRRQSKKKVVLTLTKNSEDLIKNMKNYDVLYMAGGGNRIQTYFRELSELEKLLEDKVYIGSSMGAFIVSRNYVLSFSNQDQKAHQGLGILPFNTLCHWDVEDFKEIKLQQLKKVDPKTPILTLDECQFIRMYL